MSLDLRNTALAERPVVVAGLSMQMTTAGAAIIGGPAIYAALGVRHAGISTALLTAVGQDLTVADSAVAAFVDDEHVPLRKRLARPMITWRSPAILGDTGRGTLSDDPSLWRAMPSVGHNIDGAALILANGDPDWYQALLTTCAPSLIFMDAHKEWLRMREKALNACLQKAHVVTITETEYKALPLAAKSGVTFGGDDKALIIKRGAQGVTILAGHQRRDLPPPAPTVIRTDVGCGDLLIGLLAGHFIASFSMEPQTLIDHLSQAYLNSLTQLSELIESHSPRAFIDHRISQLRSKAGAYEN
jgi:hypothetical protein